MDYYLVGIRFHTMLLKNGGSQGVTWVGGLLASQPIFDITFGHNSVSRVVGFD